MVSRRAIARAQHLPPPLACLFASFPPPQQGTSLVHRDLDFNSLSGSVPTQLAALTALELLCARPAPRREKAAARGKGQ